MLDAALAAWLDQTAQSIDPVIRFERAIGPADPWQEEYLRARDELVLVLASRQVGKSTSTAALLYDHLTRGQFALVLAPSEKQAKESVRKISAFRNADPNPPALLRQTQTEIEVLGGGRCVILPHTSDTLRGYANAQLICIDEACFCDDDAINAVLPSRADDGRVLAISTPGGSKSGFFYDHWHGGEARRIKAKASNIPRLAKRVEWARRHMPAQRFAVEYDLQWVGSGAQFIAPEVIAGAISHDVGALRL